MLRALATDDHVHKVNLVVSESALRVFAEELQISARTSLVEKILGYPCDKIQHHPFATTSAPTSPAAATPPTP